MIAEAITRIQDLSLNIHSMMIGESYIDDLLLSIAGYYSLTENDPRTGPFLSGIDNQIKARFSEKSPKSDHLVCKGLIDDSR